MLSTESTSHVQTVLTGIALGESPRWHAGRLWFSDWVGQEIVAVDAAGTREVILRGPELPVCFDWLPDGRLLVVAGGEGALLCRGPDGSLAAYADLKPLAAPPWNDIVVDGRGNTYVNCTGFNFPFAPFAPGSVALVTPEGRARQVAEDVAFPNGMVVTPDGKTLILAESYANRLTAFEIAADGSLSNRRVWAPLGEGAPDGICLDAENAVWYADVPNRRCVRVREGGEVLETVNADRGCFACMLGGADRRTLYIVAADWGGPASLAQGERTGVLLRIGVEVAGAGYP